jgi:SAM-dependent methyltransferase
MEQKMSPDAYTEMADTEAKHWWFTARRSLLEEFISEIKLPEQSRILEVGSGTGGNLDMLSKFGIVSAMEMDQTARTISSSKTGNKYDIRAGFCPSDIPFKAEKFDLICLFDVLEHIEPDVETLVALKALLKPSGYILVTIPANKWMWSAHDTFLHHKRRYSKKEFVSKINASGFVHTRISYFNTLLFPVAAAIRLKDKLLNTKTASGSMIPIAPVNNLFRAIFQSERFLLRSMNLPFGVSLLGILRLNN